MNVFQSRVLSAPISGMITSVCLVKSTLYVGTVLGSLHELIIDPLSKNLQQKGSIQFEAGSPITSIKYLTKQCTLLCIIGSSTLAVVDARRFEVSFKDLDYKSITYGTPNRKNKFIRHHPSYELLDLKLDKKITSAISNAVTMKNESGCACAPSELLGWKDGGCFVLVLPPDPSKPLHPFTMKNESGCACAPSELLGWKDGGCFVLVLPPDPSKPLHPCSFLVIHGKTVHKFEYIFHVPPKGKPPLGQHLLYLPSGSSPGILEIGKYIETSSFSLSRPPDSPDVCVVVKGKNLWYYSTPEVGDKKRFVEIVSLSNGSTKQITWPLQYLTRMFTVLHIDGECDVVLVGHNTPSAQKMDGSVIKSSSDLGSKASLPPQHSIAMVMSSNGSLSKHITGILLPPFLSYISVCTGCVIAVGAHSVSCDDAGTAMGESVVHLIPLLEGGDGGSSLSSPSQTSRSRGSDIATKGLDLLESGGDASDGRAPGLQYFLHDNDFQDRGAVKSPGSSGAAVQLRESIAFQMDTADIWLDVEECGSDSKSADKESSVSVPSITSPRHHVFISRFTHMPSTFGREITACNEDLKQETILGQVLEKQWNRSQVEFKKAPPSSDGGFLPFIQELPELPAFPPLPPFSFLSSLPPSAPLSVAVSHGSTVTVIERMPLVSHIKQEMAVVKGEKKVRRGGRKWKTSLEGFEQKAIISTGLGQEVDEETLRNEGWMAKFGGNIGRKVNIEGGTEQNHHAMSGTRRSGADLSQISVSTLSVSGRRASHSNGSSLPLPSLPKLYAASDILMQHIVSSSNIPSSASTLTLSALSALSFHSIPSLCSMLGLHFLSHRAFASAFSFFLLARGGIEESLRESASVCLGVTLGESADDLGHSQADDGSRGRSYSTASDIEGSTRIDRLESGALSLIYMLFGGISDEIDSLFNFSSCEYLCLPGRFAGMNLKEIMALDKEIGEDEEKEERERRLEKLRERDSTMHEEMESPKTQQLEEQEKSDEVQVEVSQSHGEQEDEEGSSS
ncbi:hypothetical protein ADUPG1_006875, partial [Aduncisulcus paluster]